MMSKKRLIYTLPLFIIVIGGCLPGNNSTTLHTLPISTEFTQLPIINTEEKGTMTPIIMTPPKTTKTVVQDTKTAVVATITIPPFPTIGSSESSQFIEKIASTEEICSFPCWAGIVPGEVKWNQVDQFLASFAKVLRRSPSTTQGYDIYISLPKQDGKDLLWITFYTDKSEKIKYINGWIYNYPIKKILGRHGNPDQVFLNVFGALPSDSQENFELLLSYEKKGFFILYTGVTENLPLINICSQNLNDDPLFWLWNPQESNAIKSIIDGGSNYRFPSFWTMYKQISESTEKKLSVEAFVDIFTNSNPDEECFQVSSP